MLCNVHIYSEITISYTHLIIVYGPYTVQCLNFAGINFRELLFLKISLKYFREFSNTPHPHTYGRGYFTSCAYVRTHVAYIPRTSLAVTDAYFRS